MAANRRSARASAINDCPHKFDFRPSLWSVARCVYRSKNVAYGSLADKPSQAKIQICPLLSESGQNFSPPASKASCSSPATEEYDHARQCQFRATGTQTYALEQREADRRQATATAEACLGDPDQAPDRATNPRSGVVQSGHRQQIARLRCRSSQGRGRCSEWLFRRPGDRAPEKDRAASPV